jgi:hypothetical protein
MTANLELICLIREESRFSRREGRLMADSLTSAERSEYATDVAASPSSIWGHRGICSKSYAKGRPGTVPTILGRR